MQLPSHIRLLSRQEQETYGLTQRLDPLGFYQWVCDPLADISVGLMKLCSTRELFANILTLNLTQKCGIPFPDHSFYAVEKLSLARKVGNALFQDKENRPAEPKTHIYISRVLGVKPRTLLQITSRNLTEEQCGTIGAHLSGMLPLATFLVNCDVGEHNIVMAHRDETAGSTFFYSIDYEASRCHSLKLAPYRATIPHSCRALMDQLAAPFIWGETKSTLDKLASLSDGDIAQLVAGAYEAIPARGAEKTPPIDVREATLNLIEGRAFVAKQLGSPRKCRQFGLV